MSETTVRPQTEPDASVSTSVQSVRTATHRQLGGLLLLSFVTATGAVVLMPALPALPAPTVLLGVLVGCGLVAAVLGAVALRLRRSRASRPEAVAEEASEVLLEQAAASKEATGTTDQEDVSRRSAEPEPEPEPRFEAGPGSEPEPEIVSARVLRLQVRSLETALEEQQRLLDDARCGTNLQKTDLPDRGKERALLTVAALRDVLAGQPAVVTADRIEAALNRIGVEPSFVRPALAASSSASISISFGSVPTVGAAEEIVNAVAAVVPSVENELPPEVPSDAAAEPEPEPEPETALPEPETDVPEPQPEAAAEPKSEVQPGVPVAPVVLPVPAPVKVVVPERSRRLRRRAPERLSA